MRKRRKPDLRPIAEKTLEELDGDVWPEPQFRSYLVESVHRLRRVPLKQFTIEDLRIMIGQSEGLPYLVPRALDHLEAHPLAAGDYYPGDLLRTVVQIPDQFWTEHPYLRPRVCRTIEAALRRIRKVSTVKHLEPDLRAALSRLA